MPRLERVFVYDKKELVDPSPELSPKEVKNIYTEQYPEMLNSEIEGPEIKDGKAIYTINKTLGTKG